MRWCVLFHFFSLIFKRLPTERAADLTEVGGMVPGGDPGPWGPGPCWPLTGSYARVSEVQTLESIHSSRLSYFS